MFHIDTKCSRRTGMVSSELFYWHDTLNWCGFMEPSLRLQPGEHYENPETKRRLQNLLQATRLWDHLTWLKPDFASEDVIKLVHTQAHLDQLIKFCAGGGGDAGDLTPAGPASYEIARLAVGGVTMAVDQIMSGEVDNAYVLCRPPGHHALPELAMGFCLFANAAIGVRYAQKTYGLKRLAVVDWDVHHGNGTEAIFLDDPNVLTISIHQDNLFPSNSGAADVKGAGGANLNIPLPPGSGSGGYREAFERVIRPALEQFAPEMIVVACGFDASAFDPLGVQMLSSQDFRYMMDQVLEIADEHCAGRVLATHEGGYSATYVPYCGLAVLESMSGASAQFEDPFCEIIKDYGGQKLTGDQSHAIETAYLEHFK